jgi:glutathione S-transferase
MRMLSAATKLDLTNLPHLTLYGDLNMRPFRNAWMLQELGLTHKHIMCRPWSRRAKSVHPLGKVPALLVDYPKSTTGSGDSFVVLESAAINTFLGDLVREHGIIKNDRGNIRPILVPAPGTKERAKYESLVSFMMTELDAQSLWIHRKHSDLANIFGEAPLAVKEAKRQFDNSLLVMEDEIRMDSKGECSYLLSSGFSAADILFADCISWAKHIGWLLKNDGSVGEHDVAHKLTFPTTERDADQASSAIQPTVMSHKLERYRAMCRSRPAWKRANQLRKDQVAAEDLQNTSKL